MSTAVLERPPTYEEERGKPMPSQNHAAVQANLILEFGASREHRPFSELTLDIDGASYTPDLSVYPRQMLNWRRDVIRRTDPPLLVVEILSPTRGCQEVTDKVEAHLAHGVKSCWVVSPQARTITVHLPDGEPKTHAEGTVTDPATGLTASLEAAFA
ncbi:MAG TPA: Uma2 family endonuclease [Verrucomicrobiota bacterium]|nr:Uma2 family endonuclease [Verrucomicrobiota bacterium]